MKKSIFMMVVIAMITTNTYSQCACCAGAGAGSSNGDYNNGILTLQKKQLVLESYTDFRTINQSNAVDITMPPDEAPLTSMLIQSVGARYGLNNKITISALLPYLFLHTDTGNDHGVGDLAVMGTFNVFAKNNFNVALQAGIELPTGIQKSANFDNSTVVVGSGSYDPMVGIIISKRWSKITLQGSGLYKHTNNGFQGNYYGSISVQNLTLNYKIIEGYTSCSLLPKENPASAEQAKKANLGLAVYGGYYGEWLDKTKEDDVVDQNSGYYMGYAILGNAISYKKWSFPLSLSLPIIQNMNGDQNNGGFRVRLGIIKSF
jgi:hypothetical protein